MAQSASSDRVVRQRVRRRHQYYIRLMVDNNPRRRYVAFASAVNTSSIIDETYKEVKVDALPRCCFRPFLSVGGGGGGSSEVKVLVVVGRISRVESCRRLMLQRIEIKFIRSDLAVDENKKVCSWLSSSTSPNTPPLRYTLLRYFDGGRHGRRPRSAHVDGSARGVPFVNLASRSFRDVLVVAPSSSPFIPRSGVLKEFVMWRETVSLGPSDLPTR